MDDNAKKVSITIIVILVGVIGGLWYVGDKNKTQTSAVKNDPLAASTSYAALDPKIRAAYKIPTPAMEQLITSAASLEPTTKAPYQVYTDTYTSTNLVFTKDESKQTLTNYGRQVAIALAKLSSQKENGAELVLAAIAKTDSTALIKLNNLSQAYYETEQQLKAVATPKSAASYQVKILNNLNILTKTTKEMVKALEDPELALMNSSSYQLTVPLLYSALGDLNKYFITKGIKFDPSEQTTL